MVNSTSKLVLHFKFTGSNMAMVMVILSSNFRTSRANIAASVQLKIFYVAEMIFVEIEIDCSWMKMSTSL